ncbi:hypothetical protein ACFQ45_11290 [Rhodanobacter aciditrophus]|uniref:Uncharacterized protein n=1 Tax=Rhodanobacter aciditrophus TaxID=1623218 RepID=A0ABW4B375_9GAMM
MTKFDTRVEELIAKHPHLTKDEAIKIITEKNARKKQKRQARSNKGDAN